jgi:hypothetical protein
MAVWLISSSSELNYLCYHITRVGVRIGPAHKGLPLPHCMQDILPSNLRKNFSYLALLAMQHDRLAFQNSFSVWTTYEIDPYHV